MEGLAGISFSRELTSIKGVPVLAVPITKYSKFLRKARIQLNNELALTCIGAQYVQQSLSAASTRRRAVICAAAEQTQTVTRQSSTITIAPIQGKEKSPELDDGGTGFPPRDDDGDGGGGGGGGGPHWSGGFFFFGLLLFLGFLKDKESEGPYRNERRKYSY